MDRGQHRKILPLIRLLENTAVPGSDEAPMIAALQKKYYQSFGAVSTSRDEAAIISRREALHADAELKEIFEVIWEALSNAGGVLSSSPSSPARPGSRGRSASPSQGTRRASAMTVSKEGFVKLYMNLIRGLTGESVQDTARCIAELQHDVDRKVFGMLDESGFYDWLLELRAAWSELLHPHFQPFFAWCLLDSIVDVSEDEPMLRPWSDVQCFVIYTEVKHSFIQGFGSSKQLRGRLMLKQSFQNPLTPNQSVRPSSPGVADALGHFEGETVGVLATATIDTKPSQGNTSPDVPGSPVDLSGQRPPAQPGAKWTKARAVQPTMSSVHWRRTKSRWALTHTIKVPFPLSVANVPELPIIIAPADMPGIDYFTYQHNFYRAGPVSSEDFKRFILQGEFVPSCQPCSTITDATNPVTAEFSDEDSIHNGDFNDDIDDYDDHFFPTELVDRPPPAEEVAERSLTLSEEPSLVSDMLQSSNLLDRVSSSIINEHIQVEVASIKSSATSAPSAEPSAYAAADVIDSPSLLIDSLNNMFDQHVPSLMLDSLVIDRPKSGLSSPMGTLSHFIDTSTALRISDSEQYMNEARGETSLEIRGISQTIVPTRRQNQSKRRSISKASQSEVPSKISVEFSPPKLVGFDYQRADKRAAVVKLVHQSSNGELVKRLIPSPEPIKRGRLPETHSLSRSASFGPSSPHSPPRSPSPKAFEASDLEGSLFSAQNELTEHEARSQIIRDVISGGVSIRSLASTKAPNTAALTTEDKFELSDRDVEDKNASKSQQQKLKTQGGSELAEEKSNPDLRNMYDRSNENKLSNGFAPIENKLGSKTAISDGKVIAVTINSSNSLSYASSQTMGSVEMNKLQGAYITPGEVATRLPNLNVEKAHAATTIISDDMPTNRSLCLPPIAVSSPASPKPEHVFRGQKLNSLGGSKNPYLRNLSASLRSLGYSDRETVPIVSICSKSLKTGKQSGTGAIGDDADRPLSPKPWIPPGGLETMENDRLDAPQRWEELKTLHQGDPHDLTNTRSVVKRQHLVRSSFESYLNRSGVIRSKFAKVNMLKDHMLFIGELSNAKVRVEVVESQRNTAFMPMTRKNFN